MRRGGVDEAQAVGERVHDQAALVHRARHGAHPVRGEHRPRGRVPGFLHPGQVPRPQQGGGQQAQAACHATGHQDLARGAVDAPAAPQVAGERGAQAGVPLRVGRPDRGLRAHAPPGAPPRGPVNALGPRDAGPQLDQRRHAQGRQPAPHPGPRLALRLRRPRRALPRRGGPGSGRPALGAARDVRAGSVPSLEPPFGEQLRVRAGDDGPAHPEETRERPGGRQALAGGQPAIEQRLAELRHDLGRQRFPGCPVGRQRQFHGSTGGSGGPPPRVSTTGCGEAGRRRQAALPATSHSGP